MLLRLTSAWGGTLSDMLRAISLIAVGVILCVLVPKVQAQTRSDYERRAREVLTLIDRPQVRITGFEDSIGSYGMVEVRFEDGGVALFSSRFPGSVRYYNSRCKDEALRSANQPPTLTVDQARERALTFLPEANSSQWEVTESKHYGPGSGEVSGSIAIRLYRRYYGHSTQLGDHIFVDFNARTGEVILFVKRIGMRVKPPPAQVVPEEEARATAFAALERIRNDRSREAALQAWRAESPRGFLGYAAPGGTRPDAHPTVRSWPQDLRLTWRFGGGNVVVTVDAETGLLNTVDEIKGAVALTDARLARPEIPSSAKKSETAKPSTQSEASPWLWGLLALPAAGFGWMIFRAKGASR